MFLLLLPATTLQSDPKISSWQRNFCMHAPSRWLNSGFHFVFQRWLPNVYLFAKSPVVIVFIHSTESACLWVIPLERLDVLQTAGKYQTLMVSDGQTLFHGNKIKKAVGGPLRKSLDEHTWAHQVGETQNCQYFFWIGPIVKCLLLMLSFKATFFFHCACIYLVSDTNKVKCNGKCSHETVCSFWLLSTTIGRNFTIAFFFGCKKCTCPFKISGFSSLMWWSNTPSYCSHVSV